MGRAKAEAMRLDELSEAARAVAVQAGAIKPCHLHEEVLLDQFDEDATRSAYAIGTIMVKKSKVDFERAEFMDAIKTAIEEICSECPRCGEIADE